MPNALAALLLHIRDGPGGSRTSTSSGPRDPVVNLLRYLLFGLGEVAPVTREVLREPNRTGRRPHVHVG